MLNILIGYYNNDVTTWLFLFIFITVDSNRRTNVNEYLFGDYGSICWCQVFAEKARSNLRSTNLQLNRAIARHLLLPSEKGI